MKKLALDTRPKFLRSDIARGLAKGPGEWVNKDGGDAGAGIIRRMAVITRGEARGHDGWIDSVFLAQVNDAINAQPKGMKARFTHPGLSGDGLGKFTGRVRDSAVETDVVRADLHFAQSAHETPDGDLAGYLMDLAINDPDAFGNSIAFDFDRKAELEFLLTHGAEWIDDPEWGRVLSLENFKSPDPLNVRNLPHFRLGTLRAVDAVDDPAANPDGLFHRGDEVARDAEQLLAWTLGLSKEKPALVSLDIDADRAGGFLKRFLTRHHLDEGKRHGPQ